MTFISMLLRVTGLAVFAGCAVNPSTGRSQFIVLPAAQTAHANIGFTLSTMTQGLSSSPPCSRVNRGHKTAGAANPPCPNAAEIARFKAQVERIGARLATEIRDHPPGFPVHVRAFQIGVESNISASTASNAGGRIVLASDLAALEPTDDVVAFMIAREMAHIIARHDEEDSGAGIAFSAVSVLIPASGVVVKFLASMAGSHVLRSTWAEAQRREADELALGLLERCGLPAETIAFNLKVGLKHDQLPAGEWGAYFAQSIARVSIIALANQSPKGTQLAATK